MILNNNFFTYNFEIHLHFSMYTKVQVQVNLFVHVDWFAVDNKASIWMHVLKQHWQETNIIKHDKFTNSSTNQYIREESEIISHLESKQKR